MAAHIPYGLIQSASQINRNIRPCKENNHERISESATAVLMNGSTSTTASMTQGRPFHQQSIILDNGEYFFDDDFSVPFDANLREENNNVGSGGSAGSRSGSGVGLPRTSPDDLSYASQGQGLRGSSRSRSLAGGSEGSGGRKSSGGATMLTCSVDDGVEQSSSSGHPALHRDFSSPDDEEDFLDDDDAAEESELPPPEDEPLFTPVSGSETTPGETDLRMVSCCCSIDRSSDCSGVRDILQRPLQADYKLTFESPYVNMATQATETKCHDNPASTSGANPKRVFISAATGWRLAKQAAGSNPLPSWYHLKDTLRKGPGRLRRSCSVILAPRTDWSNSDAHEFRYSGTLVEIFMRSQTSDAKDFSSAPALLPAEKKPRKMRDCAVQVCVTSSDSKIVEDRRPRARRRPHSATRIAYPGLGLLPVPRQSSRLTTLACLNQNTLPDLSFLRGGCWSSRHPPAGPTPISERWSRDFSTDSAVDTTYLDDQGDDSSCCQRRLAPQLKPCLVTRRSLLDRSTSEPDMRPRSATSGAGQETRLSRGYFRATRQASTDNQTSASIDPQQQRAKKSVSFSGNVLLHAHCNAVCPGDPQVGEDSSVTQATETALQNVRPLALITRLRVIPRNWGLYGQESTPLAEFPASPSPSPVKEEHRCTDHELRYLALSNDIVKGVQETIAAFSSSGEPSTEGQPSLGGGSSASLITPLTALVSDGLLPPSRPIFTAKPRTRLWLMVEESCRIGVANRVLVDSLSQVKSLPGATTEKAKFKAFVCACLNFKALPMWINALLHNETLLKRYYCEDAFLRQCRLPYYTSFVADLMTNLEMLLFFPFHLDLGTELRRPTPPPSAVSTVQTGQNQHQPLQLHLPGKVKLPVHHVASTKPEAARSNSAHPSPTPSQSENATPEAKTSSVSSSKGNRLRNAISNLRHRTALSPTGTASRIPAPSSRSSNSKTQGAGNVSGRNGLPSKH